VTRFKKTGKTRKETARGVTSLSSPQASPKELLVMSTLRNMTISLLRVAGSKSIAPVLDAFSNKSSRIFRFLGL
jgi:hypothetical protein